MENYNQTSGNNGRMTEQDDRMNSNMQENQSQDNRNDRIGQQGRNRERSMQERQSHNHDEQNDNMQRNPGKNRSVNIPDMPEIKPEVNQGGI